MPKLMVAVLRRGLVHEDVEVALVPTIVPLRTSTGSLLSPRPPRRSVSGRPLSPLRRRGCWPENNRGNRRGDRIQRNPVCFSGLYMVGSEIFSSLASLILLLTPSTYLLNSVA